MIELYQKFTKKFGERKQIVKCIEELSELQKVLCKYLLIDVTSSNELYHQLYDEIADVEITIEQMKNIFAIEESEIQHIKYFKHKRMETLLTDSK